MINVTIKSRFQQLHFYSAITSSNRTMNSSNNLQNQIERLKTLYQIAHSPKTSISLATTIEEFITKLSDFYETEDICIYLFNEKKNTIIFYKILNKELERKSILDEQLKLRILSIKKPVIRKKSFAFRTNATSIYLPYKDDETADFMIEMQLQGISIDPNIVINEMIHVLPLIKLTLGNIMLRKIINSQEKETLKILNSSFVAIASIDSKGSIVFINNMFEKMTGYSLRELSGSSILIYQIFPEFQFLILEGHLNEEEIYIIRRKDGIELPCKVSITQVKENEETTLILNLTDISYNLKMKEEIENLRMLLANEDNIGVAIFRFAVAGGELIVEDLRSVNIDPGVFSTLCYSSIAQGHKREIGVFGPIPAPMLENYRVLLFTFSGKDDIPLDHRMKGIQYYMISVIFPENKIEFLISNKKIEQKFMKYIKNFDYPNRMKKEDLTFFREISFVE